MSDKVLINYKGANQETISGGPRDLVRLNPGVNSVDAGVWERIMKAAKAEQANSKSKTKGGVLRLIEEELVSIVPAKGEASGDGNSDVAITDVSAKEAKEIISAQIDLDILDGYRKEEARKDGRKTVLEAIDNQIAAIKQAEEDEENKEG